METQNNSRNKWYVGAALFLFLIYLANIYLLWGYIIDDSYISLRYARNLAQGYGLVYNPGERVEGYTNFLWVIFETAVVLLGGDPVLWVKIMGMILGVFTWFLVLGWSREWLGGSSYLSLIPAAYLSINGYYIRYSLSGMETNLYGFLIMLGIYFTIQKPDNRKPLISVLCFLAAALTRPEGILFALILFTYQGYRVHKKSMNRSHWVKCMGIFFIIYIMYLTWKIQYFGNILPNTYYVRMGTELKDYINTWNEGFFYVIAFMKNHYWLPIVSLIALIRSKRYEGSLFCGLFLLIFTMVVVFEGGDWMPFFRMFVPIIPLFFLFLGAATVNILDWTPMGSRPLGQTMIIVIHLGFLIMISMPWWPVTTQVIQSNNRLASYTGKWYRAFSNLDRIIGQDMALGKWISEHAPDGLKIAVKSAGTVPYYSQTVAYDCLGVTDAHIARTGLKTNLITPEKPGMESTKKIPAMMPAHGKQDWDYILSKNPDLILEGDPHQLKDRGYGLYKFPVFDREYCAKSPIKWK